MPQIGNTFTGANGTFTGCYYRRSGEWFPGVWDRQTGKRHYAVSVCNAWAAAGSAGDMANAKAGAGAEMAVAA